MRGRLAGVTRAYARVIASPRYFPLWLGQLISNFGDTLHYIALVVLSERHLHLPPAGFARLIATIGWAPCSAR